MIFVPFFFNDTATTEIYTLSLHDALPILLMLKVSRLKLPVIWLLVSMWLNTLTKSHITGSLDRKSGSAGMPRPISYAVFCLKKKNIDGIKREPWEHCHERGK